MAEKISNDISSESTYQIHFPKIIHTPNAPREGNTKAVQRIVKFQILNFCHFFSVLLTWDHMGAKVSNNISSERTQQI